MTEVNRRDFLRAGVAAVAVPSLAAQSSLAQAAAAAPLPSAGVDGWISLFNGHDLTGWYSMLQNSGKGVAEKRSIVARWRMACSTSTATRRRLNPRARLSCDRAGVRGTCTSVSSTNGASSGFRRVRCASATTGCCMGWWATTRFGRPASSADRGGRCAGDFFLLGGCAGIQDGHGAGFFGEGLEVTGFPAQATAGEPCRPAARSDQRPQDQGRQLRGPGRLERGRGDLAGRPRGQHRERQNGEFDFDAAAARSAECRPVHSADAGKDRHRNSVYAETWFRKIEVRPLG